MSQFPNSTRIYARGRLHPEIRVPVREIAISDTVRPDGTREANPPVRVYDCSGPWGDPEFEGNVSKGLPALRLPWILSRDDVEEYEGRPVAPTDNGYLSEEHAYAANQTKAPENRLKEFPGLARPSTG